MTPRLAIKAVDRLANGYRITRTDDSSFEIADEKLDGLGLALIDMALALLAAQKAIEEKR